jgi:hypothetical protein
MSHGHNGLYKAGGISLIITGILFSLRYVLDLLVGPPPSRGAEILTWIASGGLSLALIPEVLFFAGIFLVPGVIALYYSLASTNRSKAAAGCGIIAAVIPIIEVLVIVHGRLSYPVYNIRIDTPAIAELIVAVYYGGLHAIGLMLGIATIVISLAMKRGLRKEYSIFGFRYRCFRYYWCISRHDRTQSGTSLSNIVRHMVPSGGLEAL